MWTCSGRGKCSRCTRTYPLTRWLWRSSRGCREIISVNTELVIQHINVANHNASVKTTWKGDFPTWSSLWSDCCCSRNLCISWIETSPSGHTGGCGNHLMLPESVGEREGRELVTSEISLQNLITGTSNTLQAYLCWKSDVTLFSPGRGSMPVILRPTLFLPLVDLTWICVWYFRR